MSEAGDFNPGHWKGHDFGTARKDYDRHVGRSYTDARSSPHSTRSGRRITGKRLEDLISPTLSTESTSPLVILCDETGSMGEWPATIFSKLPYLELEGQEYLGKDMEICFGAIGDAYVDKYPLQIRPFTKGVDLKARLLELVIEGGGGWQTTESYELPALYFARNVTMPKAIRPILIMIGDEQPYPFVDRAQAKQFAHVDLQERLGTEEAFKELKKKFAVYLIRKPYGESGRNEMSDVDLQIYRTWVKLLGEDYISVLPEAGRVVDVIFGILARETGRVDYFRGELEGRQEPEQVDTVYKSLRTIHSVKPADSKPKLRSGHSSMHRPSDGEESDSLLK